jgi:hypothetical protein
MGCQHPISDQFRDLDTRPLLVGATLRISGAVVNAATVTADLSIDRAPMPTQHLTNHTIGLISLDTHTNLLAFMQRQWRCWHAGTSTGRVV